jgi:hypothetical protein
LGQRYLKVGKRGQLLSKWGTVRRKVEEVLWRKTERETVGRCFTMNGMLRYYTKFVSESADSDTLFKKSDLKKESPRGFVIDNSPAASEMVSSLSRSSHGSRVLCTRSCVLTMMLGRAQNLGPNCSGLWSALKNRRNSGTETSNSATKAMFSSLSGQAWSTLSPAVLL